MNIAAAMGDQEAREGASLLVIALIIYVPDQIIWNKRMTLFPV